MISPLSPTAAQIQVVQVSRTHGQVIPQALQDSLQFSNSIYHLPSTCAHKEREGIHDNHPGLGQYEEDVMDNLYSSMSW